MGVDVKHGMTKRQMDKSMAHEAFYWLGVATFVLAAIGGGLQGAWLVVGWIIRQCGLWGSFRRALQTMYENRS